MSSPLFNPFSWHSNWDVLLILDACRFGAFKDVVENFPFRGQLTSIDSGATCTYEWYNRHWYNPGDVALISASPIPFSTLTDFIHHKFPTSIQAWDGPLSSPERTLDYYAEYRKENPLGKVLLHMMPPHLPFIGTEGSKFLAGLVGKKNVSLGVYTQVDKWGKENGFPELYRLYKESLRDVLLLILENMKLFQGKRLAISSDHGELIGENMSYDHPANFQGRSRPVLTTVPWFEVDVDATLVQVRLTALGYG